MSKLLRAAVFVFLPLLCAAAAPAQEPAAPDEEKRAALHQLQNPRLKGPAGQREAYELGKKYLESYGERPSDEAEAQIVGYVRRWVMRYELALRKYSRGVLPELPAGPRPACRRSDALKGSPSTR